MNTLGLPKRSFITYLPNSMHLPTLHIIYTTLFHNPHLCDFPSSACEKSIQIVYSIQTKGTLYFHKYLIIPHLASNQ